MNSSDIDRITKALQAAGRKISANDVLAVTNALRDDGFEVRKP